MRQSSISSLVRSAAFAAAAFVAGDALAANYQVTFNLTAPVDNVFIYSYQFNGKVYAWTLFPEHIGSLPAGVTTVALPGINPTTWAIVGTQGATGVLTSVNDSIDPPVGATFDATFPGTPMWIVRSWIVGLWTGGYNSSVAFSLFGFVLDHEDPLKTDGVTGTIDLYSFDPGVKRGTATFAVAPAICTGDLNASGAVDAADLAILLGAWNASGTGIPSDLNGDHAVNGADLAILLGAWGACP